MKKEQAALQTQNYYFNNSFFYLFEGKQIPKTLLYLVKIWTKTNFHPQIVVYKEFVSDLKIKFFFCVFTEYVSHQTYFLRVILDMERFENLLSKC